MTNNVTRLYYKEYKNIINTTTHACARAHVRDFPSSYHSGVDLSLMLVHVLYLVQEHAAWGNGSRNELL
jgi:hypothetical protein